MRAPVRPVKGLGPEADWLIEAVHGEVFLANEAERDAETAGMVRRRILRSMKE